MVAKEILFPAPVATRGLTGFPDILFDVAEARRVVEVMRLPVVRSDHAWLEAANLLMLAQASPCPVHVEAAGKALSRAIAAEHREHRAVPSNRRWAIAA